MSIIGTRPEAIKMAPVIRELQRNEKVTSLTCVTGQHREMLDQVLATFNIIPDEDLHLMSPGQDLFDITSGALLGLREVLRTHKPDLVLVHGDTTTSMAAAIAAFYMGIPVGHVEAGLRTFDVGAPFPEELNRQVNSRIARYHFAPTEVARSNLLREGVPSERIWVTGNTIVDALRWTMDLLTHDAEVRRETAASISCSLKLDWGSAKYVLLTAHRRESFGQGFLEICAAVRDLAEVHRELHFVYPVHPNPSVSAVVRAKLSQMPNVHLIPPLGYREFVWLMHFCYLVVTDSGGVQEEAPVLGKPVLLMRDKTERPEGVQAGAVRVIGAKRKAIVDAVSELVNDQGEYGRMVTQRSLLGDGTAARQIVSILTGTMRKSHQRE